MPILSIEQVRHMNSFVQQTKVPLYIRLNDVYHKITSITVSNIGAEIHCQEHILEIDTQHPLYHKITPCTDLVYLELDGRYIKIFTLNYDGKIINRLTIDKSDTLWRIYLSNSDYLYIGDKCRIKMPLSPFYKTREYLVTDIHYSLYGDHILQAFQKAGTNAELVDCLANDQDGVFDEITIITLYSQEDNRFLIVPRIVLDDDLKLYFFAHIKYLKE